MFKAIIFLVFITSIMASEESKHQPCKCTQEFSKTIFGNFSLSVESFKEHSLKGFVKSIEIKLKDKTIKIPKNVLDKIGFVKMNHWRVSTESAWDGVNKIYLRTHSIEIQSEDKEETEVLIIVSRKGFEELQLDGESIKFKSKEVEENP